MIKLVFLLNFLIFFFLQGEDHGFPKFQLKGIDNRIYTDKDFDNKKFVCLALYSNHCKVSQRFETLLKEFADILHSNNSSLVVVSPNVEEAIFPDELAYSDLGDSFADMKIRHANRQFNFPFLYDGENQVVSEQLDSKSTPHAYLFNEDRELVYSGKVGDYKNNHDLNASDLYQSFLEHSQNSNASKKVTKVYGTAIKTKEDVELAQKIKKRYAREVVNLNLIDHDKINFFLHLKTDKPMMFYLWSTQDPKCRENLLKLSGIYKIYRKRGFKLYTLNIDKDKRNVMWHLEGAQMSASNFFVDGMNIAALAKFLPEDAEKISPFALLVGSKKQVLYRSMNELDSYKCKALIFEDLSGH